MPWAIPLSLLAILTFYTSLLLGSFCRQSSQFVAIPNTLITPGPRQTEIPLSPCAPLGHRALVEPYDLMSPG